MKCPNSIQDLQTSVSITGLYNQPGTTNVWYVYSDSLGALATPVAGTAYVNGNYYVPVAATIHTHNECQTDGTNGLNHSISTDDHNLATNYGNIPNYVIGCGVVGSFNTVQYNILKYGEISSTCSSL